MARKRILLVDDDASFTNLLRLNLEETGHYEVHVENWAEDAVPAALKFKPHLVLLDIIMPRMPGGNVVALFQKDAALKQVPIIFLTAAVRKHQVAENDGFIGGCPCIAKPATVEAIVQMIEQYSLPAEDAAG